MKTLGYVLTIIGTLIGGFFLLNALMLADSAPQQAAGAAIAIAFGVLPYCFARAVERVGEPSIIEALDRYFDRKPVPPPVIPTDTRGIRLSSSPRHTP